METAPQCDDMRCFIALYSRMRPRVSIRLPSELIASWRLPKDQPFHLVSLSRLTGTGTTPTYGPAEASPLHTRLFRKAAASEETRRTLRYVEPLSDARTPLADFINSLLGSVPGCGRSANAGLRPHLLSQKSAAVLCRLAASVKDRKQPDAPNADRHREQRR